MNTRVILVFVLIASFASLIAVINQYLLFYFNPSSFNNWAFDSLFYSISIMLWAVLLPVVYKLVLKLKGKPRVTTILQFVVLSLIVSFSHQLLANFFFYLTLYLIGQPVLLTDLSSQFSEMVLSGMFIRIVETLIIALLFYVVANHQSQIRNFLALQLPQMYQWISISDNHAQIIIVKEKGANLILEIGKVICFESAGNYVQVHLQDKKYMHRFTMGKLYEQLDKQKFIRVHRSSIINLKFVDSVNYCKNGEYEISLSNGMLVNTSRNFKDEVIAKLKLQTLKE